MRLSKIGTCLSLPYAINCHQLPHFIIALNFSLQCALEAAPHRLDVAMPAFWLASPASHQITHQAIHPWPSRALTNLQADATRRCRRRLAIISSNYFSPSSGRGWQSSRLVSTWLKDHKAISKESRTSAILTRVSGVKFKWNLDLDQLRSSRKWQTMSLMNLLNDIEMSSPSWMAMEVSLCCLLLKGNAHLFKHNSLQWADPDRI